MMHCSTALSKKKKTQAFLCFHKIQVTKMTKVLKPFLRSSSRDSAALLHQVWKLLEGLGGLFFVQPGLPQNPSPNLPGEQSRDSAALFHQVWKLLEGLGGLFLSSLGSLKIQVQTSLESTQAERR
ncbi:Callose synthase 10 [Zea mays]|uniref:Callose synthase 10 n=1 Tax=Zea mays TaxID=4577 RepID=A0A1D6KBK4_MAIZE|nr:Callose synthase 10 [Zea mays]